MSSILTQDDNIFSLHIPFQLSFHFTLLCHWKVIQMFISTNDLYGLPRWWQWYRACLQIQETQECSIPGWGRSPRGGHGKPFQHSCLENPMDKEAWWTTVHRISELDMTEWLSTNDLYFTPIISIIHFCPHDFANLSLSKSQMIIRNVPVLKWKQTLFSQLPVNIYLISIMCQAPARCKGYSSDKTDAVSSRGFLWKKWGYV